MYGRGGAGNIHKAKQSSQQAAADLEANLAPTASSSSAFSSSASSSSLPAPSSPSASSSSLPAPSSPSASSSSLPAPSSHPAPQEYAHMGRGGAGNWYQPSELSKEGTFTQPGDSTAPPTAASPQVSTPWHPEGQEMPLARSGRGGAGNFVWRGDGQARAVEDAGESQMQVLSRRVEREVEAGLAKPSGVLLGREVERGV